MTKLELDVVLTQAKSLVRHSDDPRNWADPALMALKLLVAFIEEAPYD